MNVKYDPFFWWKYLVPELIYRGWSRDTWKWLCWLAEVER